MYTEIFYDTINDRYIKIEGNKTQNQYKVIHISESGDPIIELGFITNQELQHRIKTERYIEKEFPVLNQSQPVATI
jgi:hypothetical protein